MSRVFIVALPDEVEVQGKILGSPVIFSGVGKINATMAAYRAFSEGYKEVINIGSCGSLKFKPGNVVKIGQVFQDIDATPLQDFYDAKQRDKYSLNYLKMIDECSVFDMECFAIAKVCKRFNMKFKAYKWISDDGDANNWKEMCHIGFETVKNILK